MQARLWDVDKDYPTIYNWCKEYTNPRWQSVIPKEVLPKHGVMVIDKKPICASGLFIDDSSIIFHKECSDLIEPYGELEEDIKNN